ncbi:MAG: hypothetical protein C4332_00705 [Meiothermus sp.]
MPNPEQTSLTPNPQGAGNPEALAQALLEETDPQARTCLLGQHRPDLTLIEALKAQVDRHKGADIALARRAGARALEAALWVDDPRAGPLASWAYALGLTVGGDYSAALEHYNNAREGFLALGLPEEAARTAVRQVQALAMMGDLPGARDLAEWSREAFVRLGLHQDAATVGINLGIIHSRMGRIAEAEAMFLQALAQLEGAGDETGAAKAHSNLGQLYQQQDRFDEAAAQLEAALEVFRRHAQTQFVAGTSLSLVLLCRKGGRLRDALELLSRVRAAYGDLKTHPDAAFVGLEEARVYLDLNLLGEAERLSQELSEVFAGRGMGLEQAESLMTLGSAQAKAGKLEEARSTLGQAQALWRALDNPLQAALVEAYIANLLLQEGRKGTLPQLEGAVLQSAKAAENLAEMPSARALALSVLAEALLELGNPVEARHRLEQAQAALAGLEFPSLRIQLEGLLGRAALPEAPVAETHFKRAIELLEEVRSSLAVDEFKTAYLGDKLDVYGLLVDLLLEGGRVHEAFAYTERAKSRALLELLAGRGEQTGQSAEARTLKCDLDRARAELDGYFLALEAQTEDASRAVWRARITEGEALVTRLQRELERAQDGGLAQSFQVELTEIQAALPAGAVLLEYFSTARGLVAFVLDGPTLRAVRLSGELAQVEGVLERLEFFLGRVAGGEVFARIYGEGVLRQAVDEQLKALHGLLLEPLSLDLAGRNLVLVPHGVLHKVPFAALLGEDGYLLDRAEVSLAPSAAVYAFCRQRPVHREGPLVAFGVPLENIPQVLHEVEAITAIAHQAHKFVEEAATSGNFFAHAGQAQVLHLATHGAFRPDNPMFSGLRLADGWLAARDLYQLRLKAELVVLSACETGLSQQAGGDELLGLARGFLYAGTPCLVASLWPVKDDTTAQLMAEFYRALQTGLPVGVALRKAQQTLREIHPNPYYWSAFSITGDAARCVAI